MTEAAVYLFTGEEFLVDEALGRIRAEAGTDELAEQWFDASSAIADILDALQTPSLLGGRRLVIVRAASSLKKEQVEALSSYIATPAPHSTLVLISDRPTKLDAAVRKNGSAVALAQPKGRRLAAWLTERARSHGIAIDESAAWELIEAAGGELRDLDGALEQLSVALGRGGRAGAADVRRILPRAADERIYALTDAVGDRRLAPAVQALRRLLDQGDEPLVILGALAAHVRRLLRARRYAEGGVRSVEDGLSLPRWRAERLYRQARSYRDDELARALSELAEADVALKSGGHDALSAAALERAVVRIIAAA